MAIEASLTDDQKANLEKARVILGLRSRAAVLKAFADYAIEIADFWIQKAGGRLAYLGLEEKDGSE